jgi:hypothetical protein
MIEIVFPCHSSPPLRANMSKPTYRFPNLCFIFIIVLCIYPLFYNFDHLNFQFILFLNVLFDILFRLSSPSGACMGLIDSLLGSIS